MKVLPRDYSLSQSMFDRLTHMMPGGNTRTATYYPPFPLALERGDGHQVWDVDGNVYIDVLNNYSALVHGHAHPEIVHAITEASRSGSVFPAPHASQEELAGRIAKRFPSMERMRFTNSGSEAVMMAVRAARAVTGREEIVKAIGGYHGSWEQVSVASSEAHADGRVLAFDGSLGVPRAIGGLVHHVRYNDVSHLRSIFEVAGERVAAVLLEPVLGHSITPGDPSFLQEAQDLARAHGALFVLDEVITGRLRLGGAQQMHGLIPDLTVLGKIIGGGLPVGAFGGRAEIMEIFDPRRAEYVDHHGTFNGNTVTMAAGCVSLDLLGQDEIERINGLGEPLARGLETSSGLHGIPLSVTRAGSLVNLQASSDVIARVHAAALRGGIYMAPRGMFNVTTVMTAEIVSEIVERMDQAFASVAPHLEEREDGHG